MKFEIEDRGTIEWQGPGRVEMDLKDEADRTFFERYFQMERSYMAAAGDHDGMVVERATDSEHAFNHAMWELAAHAYKVRQGGAARNQRGGSK